MLYTVALASFLACSVEFTEAFTIVMAVGTVRGFRPAMKGTVLAVLALAVLVAILGIAVLKYVPLDWLKGVIGGLLLLFGLKWIRKAILRFAGTVSSHDEARIYEREAQQLRGDEISDFQASATAFNGVFLEGLEVVVIVLTMGSAAHQFASAIYGALAGLVLVLALGIAVRGPLTKVPENVMKFIVGVMLTTFGTFWAGEALGVRWPGADLALLGLVIIWLVLSQGLVMQIKRGAARRAA
ncbi:MAG: COG4280 domain-containing protein [Clostridia bacterium]